MKLFRNFINDLNAALAQNCISISGRGRGMREGLGIAKPKMGSGRFFSHSGGIGWGCRMKMCVLVKESVI